MKRFIVWIRTEGFNDEIYVEAQNIYVALDAAEDKLEYEGVNPEEVEIEIEEMH